MFVTVLIVVLLSAGAVLVAASRRPAKPGQMPLVAQRLIGIGALALGALVLLTSTVTIVDDGKVGVTRAFGQYGDETLQPGFNLILPWESVQQIDTRIKSYTFSDDAAEAISGPITAQADGGGNLRIEHTVQLVVEKATADDLLREVGGDWFDVVVLPAIRSCTRDATVGLTLEQAYTTERATIGTATLSCVAERVERFGVQIVDVLIRDVDPGQAVRDAIDAKQQAEQDLQRAAIQTRVVEEEARQEAIRSFGISQAEQIIACGGQETRREDGETVIIPNETCEDQFSLEYLQWLYIQQLSNIDGVVILPPEFDGQLFVQTQDRGPSARPAAQPADDGS